MALELALAQSPDMYDVAPPASYQEAGQLLYSAGQIVHDIIDDQPPQKTFSQILTAQMLKDLSGGWMAIFRVAAPDPSAPQPGEVRFSWMPGGTLAIAFPDTVSSNLCKGIDGLYRAATWREVMEIGSGMQLDGLSGEFDWRYQERLDGGVGPAAEDVIERATVELYEMLFRFEDDGSPLITALDISWGGADQCLQSLAEAYRNSQG